MNYALRFPSCRSLPKILTILSTAVASAALIPYPSPPAYPRSHETRSHGPKDAPPQYEPPGANFLAQNSKSNGNGNGNGPSSLSWPGLPSPSEGFNPSAFSLFCSQYPNVLFHEDSSRDTKIGPSRLEPVFSGDMKNLPDLHKAFCSQAPHNGFFSRPESPYFCSYTMDDRSSKTSYSIRASIVVDSRPECKNNQQTSVKDGSGSESLSEPGASCERVKAERTPH